MCGICLIINFDYKEFKTNNSIKFNFESLKNRGPDSWGDKSIQHDRYQLKFFGSVLQMQGELAIQPLEDKEGNILLWNGEIFDGLHVQNGQNDSKVLLETLSRNSSKKGILNTLSQIEGPWSFIYWQFSNSQLWFGRDVFGRRSLLYSNQVNSISLSSVAINEGIDYCEIPSLGIFCIELESSTRPKLFPWGYSKENDYFAEKILFEKSEFLFDVQSLSIRPPFRKFDFSLPSENEDLALKQLSTVKFTTIDDLKLNITENYWLMSESLLQKLSESVRTRVLHHKGFCITCAENSSECAHAKVAVLFSGGIDSLIIAALCHRHIPENDPIDLINVAFSNDGNYHGPDRETGVKGYQQLVKICNQRKFNFITVDIPVNILREYRKTTIANLIRPLKSVLDDSIACAIWFASRGIGQLENENYTSTAKVILTGMGSDEQLGGYSRHRIKFKNGNWKELRKEINMEISRISSRNLGRDDRIISDHGKEARFPFLDEKVIDYLNSLPIWKKTNLYMGKGFGDKLLLRLSAIKLGLESCSIFVKRAIQFGSRIAKLESRNERADDECERLAMRNKVTEK